VPCIIFEKYRVGGLIWYANRIDNLPGHGGKTGKELVSEFRTHMERSGISPIPDEVLSVERSGNGFELRTADSLFRSEYLVLAAGSLPRILEIPGIRYRIEYEEKLDGKSIIIVGGGDLALDNGLRAVGAGADVTILYRSRIKANRGLLREVMGSGVRFVKGTSEDIEFGGDCHILKGSQKFDIAAAFIGRSPNRSLIDGFGDVQLFHPAHSTSVNGLYLIGDAASTEYSQVATSSASGISCAMNIARKVKIDEDSPGEGS
jgi:thioredoxin reductase (NADPH)